MGLIAWFKGVFSNLLRKFKSFIDAAIPAIQQILIAQLTDIGEEVVRNLSVSTLTSEQKRKEAFKIIAKYATEKGLDAKDSIINLVIELAVQKFKNENA